MSLEKSFNLSLPFIKIHGDKMALVNVPTIEGDKNVPIISCIGTSRDGKSTLLDFYCDYIMKKFGLEPRPIYPFPPSDSDESKTDGIDFYKVPDKCMLVDCQGMQLGTAKYDQHLSLICYQISNIIILTVRQRLDLQVFNNMLSTFSFLPQIDEQFRRKDKPKLIIRIKDSPYEKQLKKDKDYLNKMVDKWLKKTGDQYDVIKQAFQDAFEIHMVATSYPVNTGECPSYYDDMMSDDTPDMNIYDTDFSKLNPSFVKACETIHKLSERSITSSLMKNKDLLKKMIQGLIDNPNIDFKKLDLYHNIIMNELLDYSRNHILIDPLTDQSICDKMDGSSQAHDIYQDRLGMIRELKDYTMNVKFKDVPHEIKQVLDHDFDRITDYGFAAKTKNIRIAEEIVLPHWLLFQKKFDGIEFEKMVYGFIKIFVDREKLFLKRIENIDDIVWLKYNVFLAEEKKDLENKLNIISTLNEKQMQLIDARITEYQIDHEVKSQISEHINTINVVNMLYNQSPQILETMIRCKITNVLEDIYEDLNYVRFLGSDQKIWKQLCTLSVQNINDQINTHSLLLDKPGFIEYYNEKLHDHLTKIGFLKDVNYGTLSDIQFIEFVGDGVIFCMTERFFQERFHQVIEQIIETYPYIETVRGTKAINVQKVSMVLKTKILSPSIDLNKRTLVEKMIHCNVSEKIAMFCHVNNLQMV